MAIGGAMLRLSSTLLYALEFCCAAVILGIYSYFLAVQADRDVSIPTWQLAVEGLSGVVVLYTIFAVLLTCFLGGKKFFAFLGMVFNVLCCGAMIAIAVLTRDGASSCSGNVQTPLGDGPSSSRQGFGSNGQGDQIVYSASLGTACRLNTACFAVSIIGAVLFAISLPLALFVSRHHQKEKRYGPGPSNGYTKGSGMKFWQRNQRTTGLQDPEVAAVPPASGGLVAPVHDVRPSHDTAYTGSTVAAPGTGFDGVNHKKNISGGYHTAPTGTYQTPTTYQTPATNY